MEPVSTPPETENEEKVNLLLVDDRPQGLMALEAVLSSPEYRLFSARSGFEALACLERNDFAAIVLDVQMPVMDGFETARRIRESERFRDIPILFVTAIDKDVRYVYKGYEAGAADYLFKP